MGVCCVGWLTKVIKINGEIPLKSNTGITCRPVDCRGEHHLHCKLLQDLNKKIGPGPWCPSPALLQLLALLWKKVSCFSRLSICPCSHKEPSSLFHVFWLHPWPVVLVFGSHSVTFALPFFLCTFKSALVHVNPRPGPDNFTFRWLTLNGREPKAHKYDFAFNHAVLLVRKCNI